MIILGEVFGSEIRNQYIMIFAYARDGNDVPLGLVADLDELLECLVGIPPFFHGFKVFLTCFFEGHTSE